METHEKDECREAFEGWCRQNGGTGDVATDADGNYFDSSLAEWKTWQSAWNHKRREYVLATLVEMNFEQAMPEVTFQVPSNSDWYSGKYEIRRII